MSDMDQLQWRALDELVHDFAEVFPTVKQDLGCTDRIYHKINTGDATPIRQAPHCLPIHYQQ